MKYYMSYWHTDMTSKYLGGTSKFLQEAKDFYKVSAYLVKKNHGNINLITDFIGMKELKDVADWDSIDLCLESLPNEYKKVWSLGKIKAIKTLAFKKESFLHIDHDVFLIKKIPETILNNEFIVLSSIPIPVSIILISLKELLLTMILFALTVMFPPSEQYFIALLIIFLKIASMILVSP